MGKNKGIFKRKFGARMTLLGEILLDNFQTTVAHVAVVVVGAAVVVDAAAVAAAVVVVAAVVVAATHKSFSISKGFEIDL